MSTEQVFVLFEILHAVVEGMGAGVGFLSKPLPDLIESQTLQGMESDHFRLTRWEDGFDCLSDTFWIIFGEEFVLCGR